jgi:hypothetical protein
MKMTVTEVAYRVADGTDVKEEVGRLLSAGRSGQAKVLACIYKGHQTHKQIARVIGSSPSAAAKSARALLATGVVTACDYNRCDVDDFLNEIPDGPAVGVLDALDRRE